MKSLFFTSIAAIAASTLVACGQDNNPVRNVQAAVAEPGLQGKAFSEKCNSEIATSWATGLVQAVQGKAGDPTPRSTRLSYLFKGTNVTRKTIVYSSADCSGNPIGTFFEEGTFKINNDDKGEENAAAIDMNFEKVTLAVENDDGAKIANALNLCGRNNWSTADKASDITTKADDINCYKPFGGKPRTVVNRFLLQDGNTKLYLGTQTTAANTARPTAVDKKVVYSSN